MTLVTAFCLNSASMFPANSLTLGFAHMRILLVTLCLLLGTTFSTTAQNFKVGYTDFEVLLANMPQMAQVNQTLQQEVVRTRQRIEQQFTEVQQEVERYQRQQSLLSPEARQQREARLDSLQRMAQAEAQLAEQRVGQRQAELMRPLYEMLQNAIDSVATEGGFDLILPTQVNGQPVILFINEQRVIDITRDVARRLGILVEEEPTGDSEN